MVLESDPGTEKREVKEMDGEITMQRSDLSEDQFQRPQAKRAGSGQNYALSLRSCLLKGLQFNNSKLFNVLFFFLNWVSAICNFSLIPWDKTIPSFSSVSSYVLLICVYWQKQGTVHL